MPRNHLHLVRVDLVLAARFITLKDDFRVRHLELPGHHRAADLRRDVRVLEEVHGGVALRSLDDPVIGDGDGVTDEPNVVFSGGASFASGNTIFEGQTKYFEAELIHNIIVCNSSL